jgi:hypothetical protein
MYSYSSALLKRCINFINYHHDEILMKMKKNTFCVGKMNSLQYYCPIKSEPITECINSILLTNAVADLYLTKCNPNPSMLRIYAGWIYNDDLLFVL